MMIYDLSICYKCNKMFPGTMFYMRATGLRMTECKLCVKMRSLNWKVDSVTQKIYQKWYRKNYVSKGKKIKS